MRDILITIPDRRASSRPLDPPCPACGARNVSAVVRTIMTIYFRCYVCDIRWGEPKPHASRFVRGWLEGQQARLRSRQRQSTH